MNKERDKFLTEEVLGECWHEWERSAFVKICKNCGLHVSTECGKCDSLFINNDFSTGNGFIKLWDAAKEKDWWNDFLWLANHGLGAARYNVSHIPVNTIHPDRFADAVYEFLKEIDND